ncbi:ACP S-malonyltransferase [candidate division KSB1 bacterium]|nr:ACP S-malonyltransferase [candidate division KSB1 bacterium]
MTTALLFPGQGSQMVGMGQDLYQQSAAVRELYDHACDLLGFDLKKISFGGPEEVLNQTQYTQPALFLHSLALLRLLNDIGVRGDRVAGHSLGEYTALVAAQSLTLEKGLALVRRRGQLMQSAGEITPGTMAALIGLDFDTCLALCREIEKESGEVVRVANYNSPTQIVLSGSTNGIEKAMEKAEKAGAGKVVRLRVSGAFHSPLMEPAAEEFKRILQQSALQNAELPVYSNVTGIATVDAAVLSVNLAKQMTHPVLWNDTIRNMIQDGVERFIEVGSGKVLTGLVKRIDKSSKALAISTFESLQEAIGAAE